MDYSQKVDFHSHFLPPAYFEFLDKYEGPEPDSFPTPKWDLKSHLKEMEDLGVGFSLMSISSPSLANAMNPEEAAEYARRINEEGAGYVKKYPKKLGLMAELPLPHVEESVEEAEYALDELGAYGFGLKTHYAGMYLGDPEMDPLMEVLNERKAVVVIHPTEPAALPERANRDYPIPAMEFFMDTTRTFVNMEIHDTFVNYPDITWVFPHAGAFLSILDDRIASFKIFVKKRYPKARLHTYEDMAHVYFDLAGFPLKKQLQILRKDVPLEHMLYGSDCPYTPKVACIALAGELERTSQLTDKERYQIFTQNAVDIMPRLKEVLDVDDNGRSTKKSGKNKSRKKRKFFAKLYNVVMPTMQKL